MKTIIKFINIIMVFIYLIVEEIIQILILHFYSFIVGNLLNKQSIDGQLQFVGFIGRQKIRRITNE